MRPVERGDLCPTVPGSLKLSLDNTPARSSILLNLSTGRRRLGYLIVLAAVVLVVAACGRIARPEGWSAGVIVGDVLVIGTMEGSVMALDRATGSTVWQFDLQGEDSDRAVYGTPAVANDLIYVGGYDGFLYALSADGSLKWREAVGNGEPIIGGPVIVGDMLLIGSEDGRLYAFDAELGSQIWSFETGGEIWSTPVVTDGVAYFGSLDHTLYAVSVDNGTKLWEFPTGGGVTGSVAVVDGRVYAGAFDRVLYAIDSETGLEVARFEDARGWYWAPPVAANGVLYAPSLDGRVYALDLNTLEPVWVLQTEKAVTTSPVVVGDRLVVPSNDGEVRLARLIDGGDVRRCDIGSRIKSLTVNEQMVYLAAKDKSVRALTVDSNGDPDEEWSRFTDRDEPEPSDRSRPC